MVEQKKIKLNFPLNNGGQEVGISEGALEHFTGKLVESLCKEILQNSLDARVEKNQVTVKFELLEMLAKDIPEIEGLRKSINKCIEYWSDNEKASKILKKALKSLEGEVIKVLRVSDYGTCGLTGVKEKRNSNFFNLVKSSGASSKGGQSGGSFGIGKFAPFACSFPRTVFYSTLNTNNEYAFQGVSRLVTHRINEETTQGVGYIGNSNGNKPIVDKLDIPSAFLREEIGTDLNILGFNDSKNWKESIIKSSLMSFFESIYEGKLKIIVENEIVDASNLKEFGLKYLEKNKEKNYTYEYFKCLLEKESDEKRVIKENFVFKGENFGEVELHLLKERGFRKRIAFLRSTGMKIIDKGNFRTAMQFSGILKLKGNKINSFIRGLETPSHDKLEKDRHDNPRYAEQVLKALYSFIKDKVIDFGKLNEGEELDLKGLSKYLPDNSKENELLNYSVKHGRIKKVTQEKYEKSKRNILNDTFNGELEKQQMDEDGGGVTPKPKTPKDKDNDYPSFPLEVPEPKEKKGDGNEEGEDKRDIEVIKEKGKSTIRLKKRKALVNDIKGKRYKILIESLDDKEVYIRLKVKYEDGKSEYIKISSMENKGEIRSINKEFFEFSLKENQKEIIYLNLDEEIYSSMEVTINAK